MYIFAQRKADSNPQNSSNSYHSDQSIIRWLRTSPDAGPLYPLRSLHTCKSIIPTLLCFDVKGVLIDPRSSCAFRNRTIRSLNSVFALHFNRILRIAPEDGKAAKLRRVIARSPPALGKCGIQDGERSGDDAEKDVDNDPRQLLPIGPRKIHITVDASLNNLPHHGPNARKRTDGEQKAQSDLFPRGHVHLVQDNQRHRQEGEVEGAVDDCEAISQFVPVETLVVGGVATQSENAELETDGSRTLEEFREQRRDHERDDESQEDMMRYHPSVGREAN